MPDAVILEESILTSIKKLLGLSADNTAFDTDVTFHINTVFANLIQMGVGPQEGFRITGTSETWGQFTSNDLLIENVKTYVYIKVKLVFDPPQTSALLDAFKGQAAELEWRLYTQKGGY
ncbi:hypothetical protein [Methanobrevibacter sp.]|uniref:phage head-tail connector protein n=1 Tax=Methanobrevibacter sp. TaxID=66852 RepID=UPI003890B7A4